MRCRCHSFRTRSRPAWPPRDRRCWTAVGRGRAAAHRTMRPQRRGSARRCSAAAGRDPRAARRAGRRTPIPHRCRARPDDHVQPKAAGGGDEAGDIGRACEVVLPRDWLVEVPRDVGLYGIHAHGAQPAKTVVPQVGVNAEVVNGGGDDLVGPTGAQEAGVGDRQLDGGASRVHGYSWVGGEVRHVPVGRATRSREPSRPTPISLSTVVTCFRARRARWSGRRGPPRGGPPGSGTASRRCSPRRCGG